MQKRNNQIIYSPTDLTKYMESRFESWMDRFKVEHPDEVTPDPPDESNVILQRLGNAHEKAYLELLRTQGKDICEINGKDEAAELATITAMQEGREVIYQGVLSSGQFAGLSDFLVRVDGDSKLGQHHYEVWDTKLARDLKPYFVIQLCCYADMLEVIQGRLPDEIAIVLGTREKKSLRTNDQIHHYRQLKSDFLEFQHGFSRDEPPEDFRVGVFTRWGTESRIREEASDALSRVAKIQGGQIKKLKAAGIETLTQLASTKLESIPRLKVETYETLRQQARMQRATIDEGTTRYEYLPAKPGRGLALLPPKSANDIYFDMEGYPHAEGGLEYLFGVIYEDGEGIQFKDWWAHSPAEEKLAFEQFIDWAHERWTRDPSMHIFHYAAYEVSAARRLAGRHATRIEELDDLLRNEVFVDLYRVTRQSLCIGEPSYSIKYVEHLFRDKRKNVVAKATDSVVFYDRWILNPDGDDWQQSPTLKEIRDYNEEDCRSTLLLTQWLRARQRDQQIAYTGKVAEPEPSGKDDTESLVLEVEMLGTAQSIADPEEKRIHKLLAYLLQFHKREDKPSWWRTFDREKMSLEELRYDLDCLAGLKRTSKATSKVDKSLGFEYQFDPDEDTKLVAGSKCFVIDGGSAKMQRSKIVEMDRENGVLILKAGQNFIAHPEISLLKDDFVPYEKLAESILAVVESWNVTRKLPPALADLLFRRLPKLRGIVPGSPIVASTDANSVADAVHRMEQTTLCIQGPPGCGKTHSATAAVLELLTQNKRVAITSNSHKAVENLLKSIGEQAHDAGIQFRGIKVSSTESSSMDTSHKDTPDFNKYGQYKVVKGSEKFFSDSEADQYQVIGGTAWLFSNDNAVNLVDHLFVDEAGQVSLANVVAMSRCAKNIVLLGDQMQLEQPIQGSHPDESGHSVLQYLLGDRPTIPEERGIFLNTTYRMHPELCSVISTGVYEGKLAAHSDNIHQVLVPPAHLSDRFAKPAGIIWLPVEHDGNAQGSSEEVDAIENLVNDLLQCDLIDRCQKKRRITLDDILVVAPYNMQVRLIANCIEGIAVASVDKFQGRQKPIVILTMCASDGQSSPRGTEFLFSKSRLNVAISRATTMAFIVGSPALVRTPCHSIAQMALVNFFCQIVAAGTPTPGQKIPALTTG